MAKKSKPKPAPKKRVTPAKAAKVVPTKGSSPRLDPVDTRYGTHEYRVVILGKTTEEFPFVTETGAKGCFMGVRHPHSKVKSAMLQRRSGKSWKTLDTWSRK